MNGITRRLVGRWLCVGAFLTLLGGTGCDKPTETECKQAIASMRRILGTDQLTASDNMAAAVRRCQGNSKRESVKCVIGAKNLDELRLCGFYKDLPPPSDAAK